MQGRTRKFFGLFFALTLLSFLVRAAPAPERDAGPVATTKVITRNELVDRPPHGEQWYDEFIEIGPGVRQRAVIEVTSKGNGILEIANLRLKVYDGHNNGVTFLDGLAHVEFADIDGDGFRDLAVNAVVEHWDDKGLVDHPLKVEPAVFIYLYNGEQHAFVRKYMHAPFELAIK